MAFSVALEDIERAAVELAAEAEEFEVFEQLGRALRWLDREPEASSAFREEATRYERGFVASGLGTPSFWARTGGLLLHAGDDRDARARLTRALTGMQEARGDEERAGTLYLLGALNDAASGSDGPVGQLARGRLDTDIDVVHAARSALLESVRAERCGPHEESYSSPWSDWDWIEETFVVEAELLGRALPTHAAMLEATGLLRSSRPAGAPIRLPAPGFARSIRVEGRSGAGALARVIVADADEIHFILDVRPEQFLVLVTAKDHDWTAFLADDPEEYEALHYLEDNFRTLDELVDAAVDWLIVAERIPDGRAWAADALQALFTALSAAGTS